MTTTDGLVEPELVETGPGELVTANDRRAATLRTVDFWLGVAIVVACCLFVFWKLHPELLFRNTTTNGGDTGAHIWWPAYLRDHLLPKWRIVGWAPDWYAGFPVDQFYFPLPGLMVVILDLFMPYNVAFKLVTAVGPVTLPAAVYAFGRGIRAPRPTPVFFAVASVVFLFFKGSAGADPQSQTVAFNQHIMGGTLASNLAGEFSFTIALVFAFLFLAALAVALRERRRLALPAALLAATVMSHLIVAIFALVMAVAIWLLSRPIKSARPALAIGAVGGLLTAIWSVPLVANFGYTTRMRYEKLTHYATYLTPSYLRPALVLAAVGVAVGIVLVRRSTIVLAATATLFYFWFRMWPEGHVWNLRFLPFWYLSVFLLAAAGVAELARAPRALVRWVDSGTFRTPTPAQRLGLRRLDDETSGEREPHDDADPMLGPPQAASDSSRQQRVQALSVLVTVVMVIVSGVGLWRLSANNDEHHGFLDYWTTWNYTGYEAKTGYPEYRKIIDTMKKLPPGRAFWEKVTVGNSDALGAYGGDFALMVLPYWTHGRIASMEGLYYDGAASTPYHFLMAAHLAKNPPDTVRIPKEWGVAYSPALGNFQQGVHQMQAFGVRYYMAQSAEAKQLADANPDLKLVAEVPDLDGQPPSGWKIYEVGGTALVAPLRYQPVVLDGPTSGEDWTRVADKWWEDPEALDRPLAASGPKSWQHAKPAVAAAQPRRELPRVEVSGIKSTDDSIAFDVSRPGVPVVVRASYYPNWRVDGARGPYRVTPNLMVVVPTGHHVELHYGYTGVDWLGLVLSALGLVGLVGLALWRPRPGPEAHVEQVEHVEQPAPPTGPGIEASPAEGASGDEHPRPEPVDSPSGDPPAGH